MVLQGRRPVLGILELDEGLAPDGAFLIAREGSMLHPATFDGPIIMEIVEGAFAETIVRGEPSLRLKDACVAAARRLVERGADVISADCGFFVRYQAAVAAAVNIPVVMSSLLLVPALLRQLSPAQKLAVVAADSRHCTEDLLGIEKPVDRSKVVVGGIEGGMFVGNAFARPYIQTDVGQIESEVAACVAQLRSEHSEIGTLLFECTAFPSIKNALRRITGLPIYDITDLCRLTLASVASPELS
ncbi:hypothetical protein Mesau_05773 [Mesorhizobium australicum WSM2073]|uniref:Asp/Glu/Hydantoin racemase n=3 Tax=Mesorhizobium TaxID=68287 RepID=L0KSE1_MESAW|nr:MULTISPECIES: hypothetical protein [Mesorhizobium]ADV14782.1 hypothetical protein Mesci_5722 [Mesorhizobium ciceri biovar biserrulae WSM1271]AEH90669.1 conserved hypothetical protein [Mesorhizobium opportunistum WSM2075]AGB48041.1 hypothetical protein Mesau_05773 [Mesorhizobium australicum WSM2073]OBP89866.1 hypothetical protein BAE40_13155 [Mesorhizobium loti]